MITRPLAAAALIASLFATAAHADVRFSEDFNSGYAANWQTAGDVSAQDNSGDTYIALTTASLTFEDDFPLPAGSFNLSGVAAVETGLALEMAIGAEPGAFDRGDDFTYEGSAIWRSVNVNVGDILRFDWLLATNEVGAEARPDFAFLSVDGDITRIASVADATSAPILDFLADTGIRSFEYVFTRGGAVQLAFGVVDVGDYGVTTALAIDNVSITAVPEPESWALMLAGLIGVAGAARRARR
ncbi:PEP-CTERM sorting domain-containing protein [Methyloversatilis sp. XJ19-49]|uniref:PEP-CTERM sorting domain-containing protein n=1 Tax=Methyloversatilis sp. XJ19-49 TaxID=2963429 RepID=UPI00211C9770|nr:PEP-CTERM sorting domain-containing protein [Methyloversatilis sp. XJ19-49]MCQ9379615.1 PEP-CTERM sorting domain-containing protein [Methyloversatilis sp. XJ19-49]